MRAVVDASVWVSARLNPKGYPAKVPQAYWKGLYTLVICEEALAEVGGVLSRPRIARKYGVTAGDVRTFVELLRDGAEIVAVQGTVRVGRDPDDYPLVEAAVVGGADFVVSRDEDLTRDPDVRRYLENKGIGVLTVRQFLELLAR
ncbi:MAG: putative toxin-antitoxin system toxin component, PIN family [Candidatus Sericytochromatia bacterium]|nr:putative toxin-antitoxin system toxin component, PIN family [Candidatus Tanganyikabacteria bacterium]